MLNIKKFIVNPLQENCYVLSDDTLQCVIIDCGAYSTKERNAIVDYITTTNLQPLHHILTHYHTDHCIGADTIYDAFSLLPEVHIDDKPLVETKETMCEYIMGTSLSEKFPNIGRYLTDSDVITFGDHTLTIIPTPGHSPGSVVFYCEQEKAIFSGDTLFCGGIGRTDFMGGSMFQIMQSLRRLCQLDDNIKVYPGHGPDTTIGHECATNPFVDR